MNSAYKILGDTDKRDRYDKGEDIEKEVIEEEFSITNMVSNLSNIFNSGSENRKSTIPNTEIGLAIYNISCRCRFLYMCNGWKSKISI